MENQEEEFVELPQKIVEWIDRQKCTLEITPIENDTPPNKSC